MATAEVHHKHDVITVKELIDGIDGVGGLESTKKYFLPSLQREFVWKPIQIERLFDSLMRQFPIGSFLFWQVPKEKFGDFTFYEFLRDYHELNKRHNDEAKLDGIGHAIDAVLDGQQRMNSLYIGLKGSYAAKRKYFRWDNPDAYKEKRLYLNLLKNDVPEDIEGVEYEFKFLTDDEANQRDEAHHWFLVGDILKPEMSTNFGVIKLLQREKLADNETASEILSTLYERINKDETMHYYLVGSADLDSALNIFIRVNNGGTVLKPSDLMLSFVTTNLHGKHNVRDEINDFLGKVNNIGGENNFWLDKDMILKAFLFLADGNIRFKTASFNKNIMGIVDARWDEFLEAIRLTVKLIDSFGFNGNHFGSNNSLIPIAYYILQKGNDSKILSRDNKLYANDWKRIREWFVYANVSGMFGYSNDSTLSALRHVLKENAGAEFPLLKMCAPELANINADEIKQSIIDSILDVQFKYRSVIPALSLIQDYINLKTEEFHIDHIHPQALTDEDGVQSIANLQLLRGTLNQSKGKKPFIAWLNDEFVGNEAGKLDYMTVNYIPKNVDLEPKHFAEFIAARKELMRQKLRADLDKIA
ncbi:MAG: DUF262 domain-containing protein [Selenomonadaceae bacterium]|nr:DUF262 domain-containing protein [Selenomonadaceae bacterium]